ncbi:MAG: hypothetical protein HY909_31680 [Deltaproteobacteria bacterium]|nr:hypothetical protein [Deltaproteobacteria bacterium]
MDSRWSLLSRALALLVGAAALSAVEAPERVPGATPAERLEARVARVTGLSLDAGGLRYEDGAPASAWDAVRGRRVLFTARRDLGPRELYRAELRATPQGGLLSLRRLANLTRSPLGDDGPLTARAHAVAFPTRAFGQVQSATVLRFPQGGPWRGLRSGITHLLTEGSRLAPVRYDLRLDRPVRALTLAWEGERLIATGDGQRWTLDLGRVEVTPSGATLARVPELDKPLVLWAVDTVRGLSWVGPTPIAWLERNVFGARDRWRRWAYRSFGARPSNEGSSLAVEAPEDTAALAASATSDDPSWPPPAIAPPLGHGERAEGLWVPAGTAWLRRLEGAPPAFHRTFLRLDRERPYARIVALAMDMRQLDLGMQAGVEDPIPVVGPRGEGRVPRDPGLLNRLVGAFNGAFKSEHGGYGMVVSRRVLLPPRPGAATVATLDDGTVALGTWGPTTTLPTGFSSLRQNLDPLVADGVENPARRSLWGFVLGGIESTPTVRSGLCSDPQNRLYYLWGEETTARHLGRAMRLLGCSYGMHLDMNPSHAVFHFVRVDDIHRHQTTYQQLVRGMSSGGDRFLYYTLKDFFYVSLRDTSAPPGGAWRPSGVQPGTAWLPELFELERELGPGERARLWTVPLGRVRLRLRAGRLESPEDALTTLSEDGARVLGALELGASDPMEPSGAMVDGRVLQPFPESGTRLEVHGDGVQLVDGAIPTTEAREALGGRRALDHGSVVTVDTAVRPRVALGLTEDGRLVLLEGVTAGTRAAEALASLGATEAVLLERPRGELRVRWRGDPEGPLRSGYPGATVYLLGVPEAPRVVRLEALTR